VPSTVTDRRYSCLLVSLAIHVVSWTRFAGISSSPIADAWQRTGRAQGHLQASKFAATQVVPTAGIDSGCWVDVAFTSEQNAVRYLPAHRIC
jgi:hypothetical protein